MACLHFSLIGPTFSSHIPRKDIMRHPPSSTLPCVPFPTCRCEMSRCRPQQPVPRKAAFLHPSHPMGPSCPISHCFMSQRLTGLGSRFPPTPLPPSPVQDQVQMNRGNSILSFEGVSLTPSPTFPCTFAVTQQPDFTEILRSEVLFSQNDPQASHSSIHQYCSLQRSALVAVLALNKLAEILELVRTAWCCP